MRKDAAYLKYAAGAALIALAAAALVFFIGRENAPDTVTAVEESVEQSVSLDGLILRDETVVTCADDEPYIPRRTGERVRGGAVIAVSRAQTDEYIRHLECANGGEPDRNEMAGLTLAPCGGIFSSFVDGYEGMGLYAEGEFSPFIPDGAVGKIVSGGWWFIAQTDEVKAGQSVTLCLADEYAGTVVSTDDGRVVIRCTMGLEDVIDLRHVTAKLITAKTCGIKVPSEALHSDADGEYVLVLRAGKAVRCAVETIYDGEGFCLVRAGELRQGMQILI